MPGGQSDIVPHGYRTERPSMSCNRLNIHAIRLYPGNKNTKINRIISCFMFTLLPVRVAAYILYQNKSLLAEIQNLLINRFLLAGVRLGGLGFEVCEGGVLLPDSKHDRLVLH
jgi:hypothetical protein